MVKKGSHKINKFDNPEQYKVALYIRTGKKIEGLDVVAFQKDRLEEFCKDMKLPIKEIYIDDGFNAFSESCPAFEKLLKDIREKEINLVITANLSRIAKTKHEMLELIQLQKEYKFRTILADSREELLEDKTNSVNINYNIDNQLKTISNDEIEF